MPSIRLLSVIASSASPSHAAPPFHRVPGITPPGDGGATRIFGAPSAPGVTVPIPDWVLRLAPKIPVPVRVIWGMSDKALLPVQLEGIGEVGDDVEVFPLPGVGHFAPWEAPDQVVDALAPFDPDAFVEWLFSG